MKAFFKKTYKGWMFVADKIAYIQTRIILFILYFLGIGAYGVVGFIFRIDLLDKKQKDAPTFFKPRQQEEINLERYERQF